MLRVRAPQLGTGAGGGGGITGTAAITVGGPQVAGAGSVGAPAITGTGAITVGGPQVSGTGTVSAPAITGTGAVSIRGPQVSGAGTVSAPAGITGAGAVGIAGPSLAGAGTVSAPPAITGTGAVSIAGPVVSGAGTVTPAAITGTGGVTITGPGAAGAGTVAAPGAITGAGQVTILGPSASGTGTVAPPPAITGAGAVSIRGPVAAGSGTASAPGITGTGQVAIAGPSVSGSGTVAAPAAITGTGAITVRGPQMSGAGTVAAPGAITGTGAVSITGPSAAGTGTVDPPAGAITGSGAVSIRGPSANGSGYLGTGPWDLLSAGPEVRALASVNVGAGPTTDFMFFDFSSDGTSAYFLDLGSIIYQFTLSTPWDLATATYSSKSYSLAAQMWNGFDFAFTPDGLGFLIAGYIGAGFVYRYTLATAWDISTASYTGQSFNVSQESFVAGLAFRPDGTRMFVIGGNTNKIYQYNLSTPWNLTTASYSNVSLTVDDNEPLALRFRPDGTAFYLAGYYDFRVMQYNMPSAWTLTGASLLQSLFVEGRPGSIGPVGIAFKPDGTRLYVKHEQQGWYQHDFYTPPITTAPEITATGGVIIAGPSLSGEGTATPPPITGTGGVIIAGPSLSGEGNISELQWVGATMPFTAKTILENAAVILSDAGGNRWPWTELLGWLSGALREIAIIKPSATADVIEVTLRPGTKQRVPSGYHQMLDATRNLLTSASSPTGRSGGQAITTVTRDEIDAAIPGWHNPAILPYAKAVHHVVDADADPMTFYVVPGNDGTGLIEITASVMPAALPIPANPDLIESYANINIPMPNAYEEAVLNFVIYRALSKDSMVAGAAARAQAHLALFQQSLGIKQEREDTQNVNRPTHRHSR